MWGGKRRSSWLGTVAAREAGRVGGKKKRYTELQARGVRVLHEQEPNLGRRRLAKRTGLSEKQVRRILSGG